MSYTVADLLRRSLVKIEQSPVWNKDGALLNKPMQLLRLPPASYMNGVNLRIQTADVHAYGQAGEEAMERLNNLVSNAITKYYIHEFDGGA